MSSEVERKNVSLGLWLLALAIALAAGTLAVVFIFNAVSNY